MEVDIPSMPLLSVSSANKLPANETTGDFSPGVSSYWWRWWKPIFGGLHTEQAQVGLLLTFNLSLLLRQKT